MTGAHFIELAETTASTDSRCSATLVVETTLVRLLSYGWRPASRYLRNPLSRLLGASIPRCTASTVDVTRMVQNPPSFRLVDCPGAGRDYPRGPRLSDPVPLGPIPYLRKHRSAESEAGGAGCPRAPEDPPARPGPPAHGGAPPSPEARGKGGTPPQDACERRDGQADALRSSGATRRRRGYVDRVGRANDGERREVRRVRFADTPSARGRRCVDPRPGGASDRPAGACAP